MEFSQIFLVCVSTTPIEVMDKTGTKQIIDDEGRVYYKNSTFYDHGLVHSLEIVEQLWANTKKLDNVKSIQTTINYYDSLADKLFLVPKDRRSFQSSFVGNGLWRIFPQLSEKYETYQEFVRFRAERLKDELQGLIDATGDKAKAFFIADDVAYKGRTMISPERWLSDYGPYYSEICKLATDNGILPLIHTDGDVTDLIPAFQQVGFRGLQGWEGGVDPAIINAQYPDFVVIGFVDMNEVLPFGTELQINQHVQELMDIFKANRHYMIGPSSVVNATMPIQNIRNFVDAAKKYGKYV